MKRLLIKILLTGLIISTANIANATVHNFIITGGYTMDIETTGTWNTTMDPDTGDLNAALDLNFAIVTNDPNPITMMDLIACTENDLGTQSDALKSSDFTPGLTNTMCMTAFGCTTERPTDASVQDCCSAVPTVLNNPDCTCYMGTLTIDNGGSFTYVEGADRHFDITIDPTVQGDPTNLHLTLGTPCCAGCYNDVVANDVYGDYEVEVLLTGIPAI